MKKIGYRIFNANISWRSLFEASFIVPFFYTFMEWLFIVTKPDFFSALSLIQKIRIFLFTASLFSAAIFLILAFLRVTSLIIRRDNFQNFIKHIGILILAIILGSLGMLMIDNFTYTLFHFGIITARGVSKLVYLFGYLILIGYFWIDLKKRLPGMDRLFTKNKTRRFVDLAFLIIFLCSLVFNYEPPGTSEGDFAINVQKQKQQLPYIILITADGLNANNMSTYGYLRDTTPRIKELAEHSLVAKNAFNNSGNTMGSIISIYTGKHPTETRTLYSPDILKGKDSYQHFPNILKRLGYYTIQLTHPHHVDAFLRNMLSGFDEANGRAAQQSIYQGTINRYLKTDYAYFLYELGNRLLDRLRHITFGKEMVTQQELTVEPTQNYKDMAKIDRLLGLIETTQQPVFAHIHWMGTHGDTFRPVNRTFSKGKDIETQENWDTDFYDDSILDFDAAVGLIIDHLKALGVYENTILIIGSDHSQNYYTNQKIPLIIHFPTDKHQGMVQANAQNIDIAPTLLDYLQVEKPVWMEGLSLIDGEPENRPIFGVGVGKTVIVERAEMIVQTIKPPFYQFGYISVVYCGNWYRLDFSDYHWERGAVAGYTGSCAGETPVTDEDVFGWMRDRLKQDGFDTSSLAQFSDIVKTIP